MPDDQEGLARLIESGRLGDPRIAAAFRKVARADFVPEESRDRAYLDRPVGIPHEQTTSQPSLIARMIEAAAPGPEERVLEVGTGLGFQTALLAQLAHEVVSIDRFDALVTAAGENLARAGIGNVELIVGDGWQGYPERAPYDSIIVSAAAAAMPEALVEQLAEGGRLVIPLKRGGSDDVVLVVKENGVAVEKKLITPARFVPLVEGEVRP